MREIMFDVNVKNPTSDLKEAMEQMGYVFKGIFKYDYPHLGHKWYERIKTEIFEKEDQLYYFASVVKWEKENISTIRIGNIKNKQDKNPEIIIR